MSPQPHPVWSRPVSLRGADLHQKVFGIAYPGGVELADFLKECNFGEMVTVLGDLRGLQVGQEIVTRACLVLARKLATADVDKAVVEMAEALARRDLERYKFHQALVDLHARAVFGGGGKYENWSLLAVYQALQCVRWETGHGGIRDLVQAFALVPEGLSMLREALSKEAENPPPVWEWLADRIRGLAKRLIRRDYTGPGYIRTREELLSLMKYDGARLRKARGIVPPFNQRGPYHGHDARTQGTEDREAA